MDHKIVPMTRNNPTARPTFHAFDADVRSRIADVQFAIDLRNGQSDLAYVESIHAAVEKLSAAIEKMPETKDDAEKVLAADLAHDAGNVCQLSMFTSDESGRSLEYRVKKLASAECAAAIRLSVMSAILPVQQSAINAQEFVSLAQEAFKGRAASAQATVRRIPEGENVRAAASYLVPIAKECARNAAKYGVEGTQQLEIFVDGNFELVIRFSNAIDPSAAAKGTKRGQEINASFAKLLGARYVSEKRDPWNGGPSEWVVELTFPTFW